MLKFAYRLSIVLTVDSGRSVILQMSDFLWPPLYNPTICARSTTVSSAFLPMILIGISIVTVSDNY